MFMASSVLGMMSLLKRMAKISHVSDCNELPQLGPPCVPRAAWAAVIGRAAIIKRHAVLCVVVSLNKHPRIFCLQITLSALWLSLVACFGGPAFSDAVLRSATRF
ncbi:hypothetical protein LWI28_011700 [Acer negundo]|uniref:Uncharacterized protein n=1 Tax=Acer negundo TaxID=4023 RepID=A0AAD5I6B6_ACENE|nr:hypothetical protein LWI28_011700 [Acer negundo]